jgi:hypothetical protein
VARETLAQCRVWGCLFSGPTSGGVRSDWLVPFDAARLRPVGSFGFVLSVHLCLAFGFRAPLFIT